MLRFGTYNLHFGGGREHWSRLIGELELDVVFAQESARPHVPADFEVVWQPVADRGWGSALVTRFPIEAVLELPSFAGWVAGATIRMGDVLVAVFSVHTPTIKARSYPVLLGQILDEIGELRLSIPIVIAGDFNLVSAGVRHPDEGIQPTSQEKKLFRRLTEEFGLVNAWCSCSPMAELPQTLRWSGDQSRPYHCDVLYVPKEWSDRLLSCEVLNGAEWMRLSDHNPVVLALEGGVSSRQPSFETDR